MLGWMKTHDPERVFIETDERAWTFGEVIAGAEARSVAGVEVLNPTPGFTSVVDLIAVMSRGSAVIAGPGESWGDTLDPGGAASVVFTSGSGGGRKGARLTLGNWEAAADASARHLGHGPEDTWLLALPLHHVSGLSILLRSAYAGGSVRLLAGFDPIRFAGELHSGTTMASVVPTMLDRVLDVDPGPYQGLRAVLVGGGPIPDDLLSRASEAGLPVLPTYGMTETCGQVATLRPGSEVENRAHPLPGVEFRIEDGRIAVRGPMVSPGYLGEPDRPAFSWFISSDLGVIDDDGALRVTGRADSLIVSGGENVDPSVVEAELTRMRGVDQAMVLGIPHPVWGMEVVCVYAGEANPEEVEAALRRALPGFMIPKRWLQAAELPLTAIGKPDRAAAARMFS